MGVVGGFEYGSNYNLEPVVHVEEKGVLECMYDHK
jgi:hypothetical protein